MQPFRRFLSVTTAAIALGFSSPVLAQEVEPITTAPIAETTQVAKVVNFGISESEVLEAQKAWGEALVAISTTYEKEGFEAAKALAEQIIDAAYGYQYGAVLFKPTLTVAPQTFRLTRAGALAYFVGGDPNFPNDTGFALNGWRDVDIANAAILISGNTATTMGNVRITNKEGQVTTVDKTWEFIKDETGKLRIVLHHSSLPYAGN